MRSYKAILSLLLLICFVSPCYALEQAKPESIIGKMSTKLVRGVTNVATSVVEIPKQSYLTVRDQGAIGYIVGPIKGLGMTAYRALIGTFEAAFCMVPQPGYYDPMVDPDYVWNGWEEQQGYNYVKAKPSDEPKPDDMQKGE